MDDYRLTFLQVTKNLIFAEFSIVAWFVTNHELVRLSMHYMGLAAAFQVIFAFLVLFERLLKVSFFVLMLE